MPELKEFDLDDEEQEILDAFERGELQPIPNMEEKIKELQMAAEAHLRETTISITYNELVEVQEVLSAQLHGGGYLSKTDHIKSLLDKIEAAIQNHSLAS